MEPLTSYQIADLFFTAVNTLAMFIFGLIGVMGGFMAAGLLFGQVIDRVMTWIFIGLYSALYLLIAVQINRTTHTFISLASEIRTRAEAGADLMWVGANDAPRAILYLVPLLTVIVIAAYVGSVIFFVRTRKLDPKAFR